MWVSRLLMAVTVLVGGCWAPPSPSASETRAARNRPASGPKIDRVSGTVLDPQGQPAPGVAVSAWLLSKPVLPLLSNNGANLLSDQGASYRLLGTNDDEATVRTDARGRFSLPVSGAARFNVEAVQSEQFKALQPGTAGEMRLQLAGTAVITGRVAVDPGQSPEGVDVYLPNTRYLVRTLADGTFRIEGVPAGQFRVTADRLDLGEGAGEDVVVAPGGTTTVEPIVVRPKAPSLEPAPGEAENPRTGGGKAARPLATPVPRLTPQPRAVPQPRPTTVTGNGMRLTAPTVMTYAGGFTGTNAVQTWTIGPDGVASPSSAVATVAGAYKSRRQGNSITLRPALFGPLTFTAKLGTKTLSLETLVDDWASDVPLNHSPPRTFGVIEGWNYTGSGTALRQHGDWTNAWVTPSFTVEPPSLDRSRASITAVAVNNAIYFADQAAIWTFAAGKYRVVAGLYGTPGEQDGPSLKARFGKIHALAAAHGGDLFALDAGPDGSTAVRLRRLGGGIVSTLKSPVELDASGLVAASTQRLVTHNPRTGRWGILELEGGEASTFTTPEVARADAVAANPDGRVLVAAGAQLYEMPAPALAGEPPAPLVPVTPTRPKPFTRLHALAFDTQGHIWAMAVEGRAYKMLHLGTMP